MKIIFQMVLGLGLAFGLGSAVNANESSSASTPSNFSIQIEKTSSDAILLAAEKITSDEKSLVVKKKGKKKGKKGKSKKGKKKKMK